MGDGAITFERLAVRRGAGFEAPGIAVGSLSPRINVIRGPNASGKTTLARAIRTLLWPKEPALADSDLAAILSDGESSWRITFVDGRVALQRDGVDAVDGPQVPAAVKSDRYSLCLRELLEADGESFAAHIARESAGGYDVDAAREALGFEEPTGRRVGITGEVEQARREWVDARERQVKLHEERRDLQALQQKREEAEDAADRAEVTQRAIRLREAAEKKRRADEKLAQFCDALADVRGDEEERLDELRAQLREEEARAAEAARTVERCEEALAASPMPAGGLDDELLPRVRKYVEQLESLSGQERELRRNLSEKQRICDEARRAIGEEVVEGVEFEEIDDAAIRRLEELGRELDGTRGEIRAYEVLHELLAGDEIDANTDDLRRAIDLLRNWLKSPAPEEHSGGQRASRPVAPVAAVVVGALVLTGVSVALFAVGYVVALLLLFVVAAQAWAAFRIYFSGDEKEAGNKSPGTDDRRAVYRRDFEGLDVASPASWEVGDVEAHLKVLVDRWIDGRLDAEKAGRWNSYAEDHRRRVERIDEAADELLDLAESLGFDVNARAPEVFWVVSHAQRWRKAAAEVEAVEASLRDTEEQQQDLLAALNEALSSLSSGYGEVADLAQAQARVEVLGKKARQFEAHENERETAIRAEAEARRRCEAAKRQIAELFERLEIDDGDDAELARLCAQKDDYDEALREQNRVAAQVDTRRKDLESHPAFSTDLLHKSAGELNSELVGLQELSEGRDEIVKKIQDIKTRIDAAKRSFEMEKKRAEYESKRAELSRRRDGDYRSLIGTALAEHVREKTRDRGRPAVFHRARELFGEITRGRYRLELGETQNGSEFYAFDTRRDVGMSLGRLSSGTRVQLLLAVRVAFVESQETGPMVPLVLDEALANSDDVRARAIIDAVIRLAGEGRQIFYFTAQQDEVDKWKELLNDAQVDSKIFDLSRVENKQEFDEGYGEEVRPPTVRRLPDPQGMSHEEYGEALGVDGGISPFKPVGGVHLWYLITEPHALYKVLGAGIDRWGQLKELERRGGLASTGLDEEIFAHAEALAQALEALAQARAVGRGRPVERRVLEASSSVSETFIDEVSALCDELAGDGAKLLAALEDGEVTNFRQKKIRELRDYFIEQGYLDPEEVLTPDEIWLRVLSAGAKWIEREVIDKGDLQALMARATGEIATASDSEVGV